MYIWSHEGLGQGEPQFGRWLGLFSERGDPRFGSMAFGSRERDAKSFARQQQQKYEKVEIHNIVTGPQSTWTVYYKYPLPPPGALEVFDTPDAAKTRERTLLAYGLEPAVAQQQIQGQRKYIVKAIKYLGGRSGPSLPMKLGLDTGFEWPNHANARRRAEGLSMLGYGAKVDQRPGGFFQVSITALPELRVTVERRSRWHLYIQGTILCPPVDLLIDGREIFYEMTKAIRSATHYIYVLGWMLCVDFPLDPSDPGSTLRNLLREAVKRSVEVRVMVWKNPLYIKEIREACLAIHSPPGSVCIVDNRTYGSPLVARLIREIQSYMNTVETPIGLAMAAAGHRPAMFWQTAVDYVRNAPANQGSHHEKVLIVKAGDKLIGFCGGADINPNRLYEQHDVQCRVQGHAAWQLLSRFISRWKVHPETAKYDQLSGGRLRGEAEQRPPAHTSEPGNYVKAIHTYNHWDGTGKLRDRSVHDTIVAAIRNAQRSIFMEDQYVVSRKIASLLNNKLKEPQFRSLTIVTQSDCYTDEIFFPRKKRQEFINTLMAGPGVSSDKVRIKMIRPGIDYTRLAKGQPLPRQLVHSKVLVVDDEVAIIGSANCNRRSLTYDSETSVVIIDHAVKRMRERLEGYLHGNLATYSAEGGCWDLDDRVSIVTTAAGVAGAIGSLLPRIWYGLWEIIDPQGP